jgi:predicted RNA-binding protein associated with RNAse of E/G family
VTLPLPQRVRIHYTRPPDRTRIFEQDLIHDDGRVKVTLARNVAFDPPVTIDGAPVLETGSDAVWFTFPGAWHDIGRFHRADGTFTGIYANVITPCVFQPGGEWETTDLFLDVWIPAGGQGPVVLDREELDEAEAKGWVGKELGARAREEAARIATAADSGGWPPAVVREWTRERALRQAQSSSPSSSNQAPQSRSRST